MRYLNVRNTCLFVPAALAAALVANEALSASTDESPDEAAQGRLRA